MSFNEAALEKLIIDLIVEKGYSYVHGDNLQREFEDVILEDDLRTFLSSRYSSKEITPSEINQIISSLRFVSPSPLYDANKEIIRRIVEGDTLIRDDRSQKDFHYNLIDFESIDNNIFKVCNQVVVKGPQEKRIPDTIIFVNGLPLVVFEFKSTVKENATIHNAYIQITTRYTRDIPELFKYNALAVITDGVNSKAGSIFADYEFFYAWRRTADDATEKDGVDSLFTMIDGLFEKRHLLDMIRNFIFFPENSKNGKFVANYAQYYAANCLHQSVLKSALETHSGKGGTYFGTTGSGKSLAMVYLSRLLMRDERLSSPTIVLISDRTDLDDQLAKLFLTAKKFIGDEDIAVAETRQDLHDKLAGKKAGGVYMTTIQKFCETTDLLSDRANIICISDEAHRSQLNMDKKLVYTETEVKESYGFAKYLHDALPNATYVGFTGTPIEETINIFGPIVSEYTMHDSIRDGVTVRLVYDGRFVKAVLDSDTVKKIEEYYKQCLEAGANKYQVEESKKTAVNIASIIGDKDVLREVAKAFVEHYEQRVREGGTVCGKAMFVCINRQVAWDFYNIVKEMRPEWVVEQKAPDGVLLSEEEEKKLRPMPKMKIVATRGKDDKKELWDMLGDEKSRKDAADQFKDPKSNFKIAILVDMWLTGFDVPSLDTIYIDKPLTQEHNIIQTISRVNRAYPGKTEGLIVDFVGIKLGLDQALKKYAKYDDSDVEGIEKAITITKDCMDVLSKILAGVDCSKYYTGDGKEKLQTLNAVAEYVQQTEEIEQRFMQTERRMVKAFHLCNASKDFTTSELDEIHFYMAVRSVIYKLTKGDAPDIDQMNEHVRKMVEQAVRSETAEVLFSEDAKFGDIDLFSEAYMKRIMEIPLQNTRIKILNQLLNNAIGNFKKVNKIKAVVFAERLQKLVDSYNMRAADQTEIKQILDEIAAKMAQLMEDLQAEQKSFEAMGIDYEEKAFYDILVAVEQKYGFDYPDDENIKLAKMIRERVTDRTQYADWANRSDIKAALQADIIILLAENGFPPIPKDSMPPEDYEKVYNDVIEQADNFKKYYNE